MTLSHHIFMPVPRQISPRTHRDARARVKLARFGKKPGGNDGGGEIHRMDQLFLMSHHIKLQKFSHQGKCSFIITRTVCFYLF